MSFEIVWKDHGAIKCFRGAVTGADLLDSVVEIGRDPRFDSLRYVIHDFRETTAFTWSASEIEEVSALDRAAALTNPNIVIGIVATLPAVREAAQTYIASPLGCYATQLFPTLAACQEWIGDKLATTSFMARGGFLHWQDDER